MNNIHLTPLQWFNILVPLLLIPIILLRWLSQRGKPAPVRTYRQGCMGGLLIGLSIGFTVGIFVGTALGMRSMLIR